MAVKDVESKCWILALFVRDDGERFLLGDGKYEFTEEQMHFAANVMANDVVEVQGNDGYMLAGQVRRPDTQSFDGYIGDSSTSKTEVEACRQAFFKFFRKNFFYKVIYIFSDGSAIQRKRGFLVDAPEAKELYQIYPKYHVALNFEDINYYYYDENADGDEIYGKSATISLDSAAQTGGLVWIEPGTTTITEEGTSFTINNTIAGGGLSNVEVKGQTEQQTYSGKNLYDFGTLDLYSGAMFSPTRTDNGFFGTIANDTIPIYYNPVATSPIGTFTISFEARLNNAGTASLIFRDARQYIWGVRGTLKKEDGSAATTESDRALTSGWKKFSFTITTTSYNTWSVQNAIHLYFSTYENSPVFETRNWQIESGSTATSYEPYTGGTASPNPDYPQEVQTATGRQVVTISNGAENQEYEVNLGKNLYNVNNTLENRYLAAGGTWANDSGTTYNNFEISVKSGSQLTMSFSERIGGASIRLGQFTANGTYITRDVYSTSPQTVTLKDTTAKVVFSIEQSSSKYFKDLQIELGSTATTYAPYFEPIELCKIGTIYKENGGWWVYKEIGKQTVDASAISVVSRNYDNVTYGVFSKTSDSALYGNYIENIPVLFTHGIQAQNTSNYDSMDNIGKIFTGASTVNYWVGFTKGTTLDDAKTALNGAILYYPLATPTTTQITNEALVEQLEALANATTYAGQTTFSVDGNGNLAAILGVELEITGGGGVLWEDNGAVWEEGKPAYSTIMIDSIDNVYPVVRISGRTVNPILTDVSTGTIFQYNGTITDSQVLVIDMMNKTATLNGTSVIGNVTGDWLYLAPGANRITYTADNATAPNATLEWQEIVG